MNFDLIIYILSIWIPLVASVICFVLVTIYHKESNDPTERRISLLAMRSYSASVIGWTGILIFLCFPFVFVFIHSILFLFLLLMHVFLYHLTFEITATGSRKFPLIHFLIPFLLSGTMVIWSFFVPFDVQLQIAETKGMHVPEYKLYSIFFTSKIPFFFIYNLIYPTLSFIRIRNYRKAIVNYSADEGKASMMWLYQLFFVSIASLPISFLTLIFGNESMLLSSLTIIPVSLTIIKDVILAYNVLTRNYVLISFSEEQEEDSEVQVQNGGRSLLEKQLEKYMNEKKPYLNPEFKITDLADDLSICRSSASSLINKAYGVNFTTYVNMSRLKELEELEKLPEYDSYSETELVELAGFSNYYGYKRFKKKVAENKRPLLN